MAKDFCLQVAKPSRTALRVALRRAAHQVVDQPPLVLADPFAVRILGAEARRELERTPQAEGKPFSAGLRAWVVGRARFAEDVLAEMVARCGAVQYLVLGAGLDTFALRNPYPQVRVFEVDHPATQAWKRERLAEAGLAVPESTCLIAVDFERDGLRERMLEFGFDVAVPTVTAWLGVVPYLTPEAFRASCQVLSGFAAGLEVVFDYGQPREALPEIERLMLDSLAARVAQAGEPFQLFFTPKSLAEELSGCGLEVVEDVGGEELNSRYFAGRTDGLGLRGTAGRICRAVLGK